MSWVLRVGPNPSLLTTNLKMRVCNLNIYVGHEINPTIGEKARITAAGGFVDFGRVNGNLALSRAIGDFEFKKSAGSMPLSSRLSLPTQMW